MVELDMQLNPNALVQYQRHVGRVSRLQAWLRQNKPAAKRKASLEKEISVRKAKMAAILKEVS